MRGYIYDQKLVIKPGPAPGFYRLCPAAHRPRAVCTYLDDHRVMDVYTYQYVEGRQATLVDVPSILKVCQEEIWRSVYEEGTTIKMMLPQQYKNAYGAHVLNVTRDQRGIDGYDKDWVMLLEEAVKLIIKAELPLVANVHGDLTFENVLVQEDNNIVFIDPGETRGAHTPALDRGKLLQSFVMRWEQRDSCPDFKMSTSGITTTLTSAKQWPWLDPNPFPEWADELDWAFLVTHWARLVRHWPEYDIMSGFATLQQVRP